MRDSTEGDMEGGTFETIHYDKNMYQTPRQGLHFNSSEPPPSARQEDLADDHMPQATCNTPHQDTSFLLPRTHPRRVNAPRNQTTMRLIMTEYVAIDRVVGLHFTLTDAAGEVLDASDDGQPMHYLHGHGNLVPGLEAALTGAEVGSKHTIVVAPADGYGEATVEPQPIPREHFPPFIPLEPGLQLSTRTEDGALVPI